MADRLLADVGASNTRVGLADDAGFRAETARNFRNDDFRGLTHLLAAYLEAAGDAEPKAVCAGVAGPVRNGAAKLTNRDWLIEADNLRAATGAQSVVLINDLQAQGYALDDLAPSAIRRLIPGLPQPSPNAPRLVLGLGTGCNIAAVHRRGGNLFVPPSEAGHARLPHAGGQMAALLDHLAGTHPHLPVESALSGPGLANIYAWLTGKRAAPSEVVAAHERGDAQATEALSSFARLLGFVAGNLCLSLMATGGLYLIGGTARAVAPHLSGLGFLETFTDRGPYTDILQATPVSLITDDTAALTGCARCLRQLPV